VISDRIKVVLGIDMETDIGSWTPYYGGVRKGTPRLLSLMERLGITGTFFFTGEAARENPAAVQDVLRAGHEVGCYSLYRETVGDELFPIPGVKSLLPEEVPGRLALATEWMGDAAGLQPASFRCPRLWGRTAWSTRWKVLDMWQTRPIPCSSMKSVWRHIISAVRIGRRRARCDCSKYQPSPIWRWTAKMSSGVTAISGLFSGPRVRALF